MNNYLKIALFKSLLIVAGFCGYSQTYFENAVDVDSMPGHFSEVLQAGRNYFAVGANMNYSRGRRELVISKFDSVGSEMWTKVYGDTLQIFYGLETFFLDSTLRIAGTFRDSSTAPMQLYVADFDTSGILNWIKFHKGDSLKDEDVMKTIMLRDSSFLLIGSGVESNGIRSDVHVLKVNYDGDKIWENWYGHAATNDWGGGGIEMSNGDYLICGASDLVTNTNQYLLRINEFGDLLWDSLYLESPDQRITEMENLQSGYFILINGFDLTGSDHKMQLYGIDGDGEFAWKREHVVGYKSKLNGVIRNFDGTFLCFGSSSDASNFAYAFLMLITPRGDTIWTRDFQYNSSNSNYPHDIIQTRDSSFIFAGVTLSPTSDGWIKKLDCMGCDSVQCYFPDSCFIYDCHNDYPPVANFTLAEDTFFYKQGDSIAIKFENSGYDAAAFTWFFSPPAGQAGTGDSLNLVNPKYTFYQPGDYEITLVARNLECTDTAKATLHIIDATGTNESFSNSNGIQVVPNPFSQNVRISAPTNGALCIYNELGQMVFQQTIIQNKPIIVEGNELGNNGIYFVILSTSEGKVLREKIILQH